MSVMRFLILLTVFSLTLPLLIKLTLSMSIDETYEATQAKGSYDSGDIVKIMDIKNEVVSLTMNGEEILLEENESYIIKDIYSQYKGSVKIMEIKGDKVSFEVNAEKTIHFYFTNILLASILSMLFTIFVGTILFRRI